MRKRYPTDLSEDEWSKIERLFKTDPKKGGRPSKHTRKEIVDAIFYILSVGCSWRLLPHDFPPWQTVYSSFRHWQNLGIWEEMNTMLRKQWRIKQGRKRHILVDTQGVLLTARIDGANEQDAESFLKMFEENLINSLSMIWADSAYRRAYLKEALADRKIKLSIVGGGLKEGFWIPKDQIINFEIPPKKFQVQPRRWIVERTFAWLNRNRRLSKDYEYLTDVSASYLYLGMSRILLRRLIKI